MVINIDCHDDHAYDAPCVARRRRGRRLRAFFRDETLTVAMTMATVLQQLLDKGTIVDVATFCEYGACTDA